MSENKLNILFVDDEPNLLNGLKRMLFSMRKEWNQFFATNGYEALQIMGKEHIDIIVSDMRMPKINGFQLLTIVREKFPDTIRIILSGHSDDELAVKSTNVAHQFLSKPCNPEQLKKVIKDLMSFKKQVSNPVLQKVVTNVDALPTMPELYIELEEELKNEGASSNKVGAIIAKDPSLTAKILQVVNSAFFGIPSQITNPAQAVSYLGINVVKSLVLYISMVSSIKVDNKYKDQLSKVWHHSLSSATFASDFLSFKFEYKPLKDVAYVATLLHDVGKIILLNNGELYEEVIKYQEENKVTYLEAEKVVTETTHPQVAAYLLGIWGLPLQIIEAIENHHVLEKQNKDKLDVSNVLYIANLSEYTSDENKEEIKKLIMADNIPEIFNLLEGVEHD